jgi:hypothetical protein
MEATLPPGIATPLHVHHREAEAFYLLAGTLDHEAGGQLHRLAAGSLIWLPKDVPHRFRVTGDAPARFLALGLPAGSSTSTSPSASRPTGAPSPAPTRPSPSSPAGAPPRPPTGSRCSARHSRHSPTHAKPLAKPAAA